MDSKLLKSQLRKDNILDLLESLGAEPKDYEDTIISRTICHDGTKHKLYYYKDNQLFVCYTGNCGSMDIFSLVEHVKDCNFFDSLKYIQGFFHINNHDLNNVESNKLFNPAENLHKQLSNDDIELKQLPTIDKSVLLSYYDIAYIDWIKEGIKPSTIFKYSIKLSITDRQIIIPHFDENNYLVGVRCRNLSKEELDAGRKYVPITYKDKTLSYPTGKLLYGLNQNKDMINKCHKVILFESEKSVLKLDSFVGNRNIALGINGSNLTSYQIKLLRQYNINEVIIALDKEFEKPYTTKEHIYAEKIESECVPLQNYFNVSVVWDKENDIDYKDSPIDKGFKTFKKLLNNRIYL